MGESEGRHPVVTPDKKTVSRPSYVVIIDDPCVGCRKAKHPLYSCKMFQALSHECKIGVVKDNKLHVCLNSLGSGHFVKSVRLAIGVSSVTDHITRGCILIPSLRIVRQLKWVSTLRIQRTW